MTIAGEANLARETQQLKVHVQPTLSGSVSVGAAALILANPIIGAAVGAGTLLAQKIMQDPLEQMFSNDYVIGGTWSEPTVERASRSRRGGPAVPSGAAGSKYDDGAALAGPGNSASRVFASPRCRRSPASDVAENLRAIEPLIAEAARQGAQLIVLPEYFGILGARATDKVAVREADGDGPQQAFPRAHARANMRVWMIGGTVPIAGRRRRRACAARRSSMRRTAGASRATTRCTCSRSTRARERYDEAETIEPGTRAGRLRYAVRARRAVRVLRPALSGALSELRRSRADRRAVGVHG